MVNKKNLPDRFCLNKVFFTGQVGDFLSFSNKINTHPAAYSDCQTSKAPSLFNFQLGGLSALT